MTLIVSSFVYDCQTFVALCLQFISCDWMWSQQILWYYAWLVQVLLWAMKALQIWIQFNCIIPTDSKLRYWPLVYNFFVYFHFNQVSYLLIVGNGYFLSDCVHIQMIICTVIKQSKLYRWTASRFYFALCLKTIDDCNLIPFNLRKITIGRRTGSFNRMFIEYLMINIVIESWWSFLTSFLLLSHINVTFIIWCRERSFI